MVIHYKCPNCGNDMEFKAETGHLTCDSCGREEKLDDFPEELKRSNFSEEETKQYHCENCGAILVTTPETSATNCSFCGAGVVIAERVSGMLAPAKVIPFRISREEAEKAFKKWCRKGLLTPKGFLTGDRIKSITGMYVPFWLFDLNSKVEAEALCTKVRTYSSGEYIYTETKFYEAYRHVNLDYVKIPVDASTKMNDELMDLLEPFPYEQLKEFKTPYLAGYLAEKYNYNDKELLPRAKDKISHYIEAYVESTFAGYQTTQYRNKNIDTKSLKSEYVLLPVWMVGYDYNGTQYMFAMNGQTGKVVGKPPLSKKKMALWYSSVSTGTLLLLKSVSFMLGGGFW